MASGECVMGKLKRIVPIGLVVLLLLYFSYRGLLISTDAKEIKFESDIPASIPCPPNLQVKGEYYQQKLEHFMNFTLTINGTLKTNITLKGPAGKHFCTPEGVFIYAYYPGDEYVDWIGFSYYGPQNTSDDY